MANRIVDPKQHPEAVLGDSARAEPLRSFKFEEVAFVYGSRFKQRCFPCAAITARVLRAERHCGRAYVPLCLAG